MALEYGFTLGTTTTSEDFSNSLHAVTGDGITLQGSRFALTLNGFTATLGSGYALAAGRWLRSDEPRQMTLQPSGNNEDRVDALAVRVDFGARTASLEVLTKVDPVAIQADPALIRNKDVYTILLYLLRIRRGATTLSPEDVTDLRADKDLCGEVVPLTQIAKQVLYIYQFLTSGIDLEVDRLLEMSRQVVQKADEAILYLEAAIQQAGGTAEVGELLLSRAPPAPAAEWLLCSGGVVPAEYPALSAMLEGNLPDLSRAEDRYRTYIYGGPPQMGRSKNKKGRA